MSIFGIKFMKQVLMRKVVYSLIPIILASVYFFGWRSVILMAVVTVAGVLTEWAFKRKGNKPVSEAVFVTAILFTLTLPPQTPYWVAVLGIVFGIVFGKEVFGGFGRNVFNPALVGRAFIYVSFPKFLTIEWTKPFTGLLGGFTHYLGEPIDAVTTATPMLAFRATGETMDFTKILFGQISGSLGETSALLIILAGIYLVYTKTANKEGTLGTLVGFLAMTLTFNALGVTQVPDPLFGLFSGGILFAAVFMVTDPISSPKTKEGRWIYGILIGIVTVVIRGFALFAGGVMFAILIGNSFAPIIDETVKYFKGRQKAKAAAKEVT